MLEFLSTLKDAAMPHLTELVLLIFAAITARIGAKIRQKSGLDIEQRYRDALHSALITGARLALARKLSLQEAIDAVLRHAFGSVPDAITGLGASRETLVNLAESKLQEVGQGLQDAATEALLGQMARLRPK